SEPHDAEASKQIPSRPSIPLASSRPSPRGRWRRWLSGAASLLVIAGIVGAALALLRTHASPAATSNNAVVGTPVVREAKAGGLDFVLRVTPGPYFLGELLVADLSLANDSHTTYTLGGPKIAGPCGAAVSAYLTGDNGPQRPLGVAVEHSCPFITSTLGPGQKMTLHEFLNVSTSGDVTLETGANFLQTVTGPGGSQATTSGSSPLDGLWPTIAMQVAAATPANRQITLRREGAQVRISAPAAALTHLYYIYTVDCVGFQGGTVGTGNFAWEPISTTTVHEPNCGDYGDQVIQWAYAVSAPGYAIASGQVHS
ncbi:MAG TPA: hypothetical protein VJN88_08975, partial [Ktedonobacterales bacterium]|nr:hypothetical protein [Ktedonobacterales bacterium]